MKPLSRKAFFWGGFIEPILVAQKVRSRPRYTATRVRFDSGKLSQFIASIVFRETARLIFDLNGEKPWPWREGVQKVFSSDLWTQDRFASIKLEAAQSFTDFNFNLQIDPFDGYPILRKTHYENAVLNSTSKQALRRLIKSAEIGSVILCILLGFVFANFFTS